MKWKVLKSDIHGNGVFASENVAPNTDLGVAISLVRETSAQKLFHRNTFGLLVNESKKPNAKVVKSGNDWHFVSIKDINKDEEILLDYQDYLDKVELESIISGKQISVI